MSEQPSRLLDCKGIQQELGVKRSTALALMEKLPKVTIEGHRRVFVKRADVEKYLEEQTAA